MYDYLSNAHTFFLPSPYNLVDGIQTEVKMLLLRPIHATGPQASGLKVTKSFKFPDP